MDYINDNILVLALYSNFENVTTGENWPKGTGSLSVVFLIIVCESTVSSIKKKKKLNLKSFQKVTLSLLPSLKGSEFK